MTRMSSWDHGVMRLELTFMVRGFPQRNVFHVQDLSGEQSPQVAQFVVDQMPYFLTFSQYGPAPVQDWLGQHASFGRALVRFLPVLGRGGPARLILGAVIGLATSTRGDSLPPNFTPALSWHGPARWVGGRPRTYLCGLSRDWVNGDHGDRLTNFAAAGIRDTWATLPQFILDSDPVYRRLRLVTYHRDGLIGQYDPLMYATAITTARWSDQKFDSQRGRLPGHVRH